MARPKAVELTSRELAVMQVFWQQPQATADEVRQRLLDQNEELAYVTVANVIRGLADKGFLKQLNSQRPYVYSAVKSFNDVSQRLVGDLVQRLFRGSTEALLVQLLDRRSLSDSERSFLQEILQREEQDEC